MGSLLVELKAARDLDAKRLAPMDVEADVEEAVAATWGTAISIAERYEPALAIRLDTERLAVVAAARRFLSAHDRVIESDPVTRDDTFAMKRAGDILRAVIQEYDAALALSRSGVHMWPSYPADPEPR